LFRLTYSQYIYHGAIFERKLVAAAARIVTVTVITTVTAIATVTVTAADVN
jgi:hypothetical protein